MQIIHTLLSSPGEPLSALLLLGRQDSSPGMPAMDAKTVRDVRAALDDLKEKQILAADTGDENRVSEIKEEMLQLTEYLARELDCMVVLDSSIRNPNVLERPRRSDLIQRWKPYTTNIIRSPRI